MCYESKEKGRVKGIGSAGPDMNDNFFLKPVSVGFFIKESIWLLGGRVFKVVVMASAEVQIWEVHEQRNKGEKRRK